MCENENCVFAGDKKQSVIFKESNLPQIWKRVCRKKAAWMCVNGLNFKCSWTENGQRWSSKNEAAPSSFLPFID